MVGWLVGFFVCFFLSGLGSWGVGGLGGVCFFFLFSPLFVVCCFGLVWGCCFCLFCLFCFVVVGGGGVLVFFLLFFLGGGGGESVTWCRYAETAAPDQICNLTLSQCSDTGPTTLNADPATQRVWQGSRKRTSVPVESMTGLRDSRGAIPGVPQRWPIFTPWLLMWWLVCWLVACLLVCFMSQQHASVSHGRIFSHQDRSCRSNFLSHPSQFTDTWTTCPSADPVTPGAWQVATRMQMFKTFSQRHTVLHFPSLPMPH